jgi:hypothetical protein
MREKRAGMAKWDKFVRALLTKRKGGASRDATNSHRTIEKDIQMDLTPLDPEIARVTAILRSLGNAASPEWSR